MSSKMGVPQVWDGSHTWGTPNKELWFYGGQWWYCACKHLQQPCLAWKGVIDRAGSFLSMSSILPRQTRPLQVFTYAISPLSPVESPQWWIWRWALEWPALYLDITYLMMYVLTCLYMAIALVWTEIWNLSYTMTVTCHQHLDNNRWTHFLLTSSALCETYR